MKHYTVALALLVSSAAFAQEPPLVRGQFAFQPKGWEGAQLSDAQKKDLDECVAIAAKQAGTPKEDRAALDALYGMKPGQADFQGAVLSGCLADEKQGKGWVALKRNGQAWEAVSSRHALRSFMGMDPSK